MNAPVSNCFCINGNNVDLPEPFGPAKILNLLDLSIVLNLVEGQCYFLLFAIF